MLAKKIFFLGGERPFLQENRIGHRNLSDVVNDAGAAKRGDLFGFEAQARAEKRGNFREALAVAVSGRIARFDAAREAEKNGFGIFEFVGVIFQAQQRTRAREKLVEVDRLAEEIVRACVDSLNAIGSGRQSGDQNYGREPRFGHGLDLPANFETTRGRASRCRGERGRDEIPRMSRERSRRRQRRALRILRGATGFRDPRAERLHRRRGVFFEVIVCRLEVNELTGALARSNRFAVLGLFEFLRRHCRTDALAAANSVTLKLAFRGDFDITASRFERPRLVPSL